MCKKLDFKVLDEEREKMKEFREKYEGTEYLEKFKQFNSFGYLYMNDKEAERYKKSIYRNQKRYKNMSEEQKKEYLYNQKQKYKPNNNFRIKDKEEWINSSANDKMIIGNILASANPKARKRKVQSSERKGVRYDAERNKWEGYLCEDGHRYKKRFDTEKEAIDYREFLEDTYYTKEQLEIRNRYKEELNEV